MQPAAQLHYLPAKRLLDTYGMVYEGVHLTS